MRIVTLNPKDMKAAAAGAACLVAALAGVAGCSASATALDPWVDADTPATRADSGTAPPAAGGDGGAASPTTRGDAGAKAGPPEGGAADATPSTVRDASSATPDGSGTVPMDAGAVVVSGDAGVAPYKGVANSACNDLVTLGASWYYNWTLSPGSCKSSSFVPMVWGHTGAEQTAAGIVNEVKGLAAAGYGTVLGFNEPDNTGQSNIPVATAITLWPSFIQPNVRVGSPATQGNATGLTWLSSFMSQVNADTTGKLRVDFIAAHWYGWNAGSCDANGANLESYLKQLEAIPGNRPIWLTEWGCLNLSNPTEATVQAFFTGAVAMFKKHPRLERYAWYPWTTNNELVDTTDALTSLGTAFQGTPAAK